jgi:hypothetical protein
MKIRTILSQHKRMATLLGSLYSPGMRFFPEDDDKSTEDKVISDAEKEAQVKRDKELEVEKQKARQHEVNAAKAKERADNAQAALDNLTTQHEADKAELATLRAAQRKTTEVSELNVDDFEEAGEQKLAATINALVAKTKADREEIEDLKKTKADLLKQQKEDQAAAQRTQQYNEILDDFDKDYGHEYRNAAVNAFNALVAEGKVPAGTAKATRVMEKCYQNAVKAAKEEAKEKKGSDEVVLDTGRGGGDTTRLSKVKLTKGSLDEVAAQAEQMLTESTP